MNTMTSSHTSLPWGKISFWIATAALVLGLSFSFLSWLELCVEHCSVNQNYRLFGLPFAPVGMAFFIILLTLHILSYFYTNLSKWVGWMIASALGAEGMFIVVQKYQIGHWCPVCLTIAFSVFVAALAYTAPPIYAFLTNHQRKQGETMNMIRKGLESISFLFLGFLFAFIGVSKVDPVQAAMQDIKHRLVFGNPNSQVEVYFITDWFCPSCRKIDPDIQKLFFQIQSQVAFYFIDYPIHQKSLNFSPYNLSFLINDKSQYFKARQLLAELADETDTPTDADIIKIAQKANIPFKELSYLDIKTGLDFFDKVSTHYDLSATPMIVITNTKTHKTTKFEGRDEISDAKILEAIHTLNK